jgi:benzoyl-CoA reductase subunit BamC
MCEGEEERLCVKWCLSDALILEEKEEEGAEEEQREEMEIGLEALAKKHGMQKVMDAVARMSMSKKG